MLAMPAWLWPLWQSWGKTLNPLCIIYIIPVLCWSLAWLDLGACFVGSCIWHVCEHTSSLSNPKLEDINQTWKPEGPRLFGELECISSVGLISCKLQEGLHTWSMDANRDGRLSTGGGRAIGSTTTPSGPSSCKSQQASSGGRWSTRPKRQYKERSFCLIHQMQQTMLADLLSIIVRSLATLVDPYFQLQRRLRKIER